MYVPSHFKVEDAASLHRVMAEHPLALLVSAGGGGLIANSIPFSFDPGRGAKGVLRAHLARANPQWREIAGGAGPLVIFQGVERYISPSLYATKPETHKVVPTWNYVMVQARGKTSVHEDAAWLRPQIERLTRDQEGKRAAPWAVGDAPADFVAQQMRAIVGIEIEITELRGKFKVSQNRPAKDRDSVLRELDASGSADDGVMAALLRQTSAGH